MRESFSVETADYREAVGNVMTWFAAFAKRLNLPDRARGEAYLALDEIVTNIAQYAYRKNQPGRISTTVSLENGRLEVEVVDEGKAFNPLVHDLEPVDVPLEQRREGGVGIRIAMHVVDEMHYRRRNGRNHLMFAKVLEPQEESSASA